MWIDKIQKFKKKNRWVKKLYSVVSERKGELLIFFFWSLSKKSKGFNIMIFKILRKKREKY